MLKKGYFCIQNKYEMESLDSLWRLIVGMVPFLMLGFLCAGLLHVVVPQRFYTKYLSNNSISSVLLAALFGIPLPLCSCGVLPTAMSLRKEGASKGATVAFLTATPQTGVDSILATYSVFGLAFTVIRPIAALVTSLLSGSLVTIFDKGTDNEETQPCGDGCECECGNTRNKLVEALRYGYVAMLQDIGTRLVVGLLLAGVITVAVPDSFLLQFSDSPLLEMLAVLVIAVPMYVCATGSIPVAAALMLKGLSPGAALVFLMAGPAVNFASVLVVKKVMGMRTVVLYLVSIVLGAIFFGFVIDGWLPQEWFSILQTSMDCCQVALPMWKIGLTIAFFLLIINALLMKYKRKTIQTMEQTVTYKVVGMSCNHCKMSVETNLAKLQGVNSVHVDLPTGTAVVEGSVSDDDVRNTVESLGFTFGGRL